MSRRLTLALYAAVTAATASLPAIAEDSYTTRIEPRPFYGATVTIEAGVRVFRPIPATRHMIINPGGQTPLNLSQNDTRVIEQSTSTNYKYNYDTRRYYSPGSGNGFPTHFHHFNKPGY